MHRVQIRHQAPPLASSSLRSKCGLFPLSFMGCMQCDGIAERRSCRNNCQTRAQSGRQSAASFCMIKTQVSRPLGPLVIERETTCGSLAAQSRGRESENRRPLLPEACTCLHPWPGPNTWDNQ